MPKLPKMERSEQTKKKYKERTISLLKKARKEFDLAQYENLEAKQFIGWLIANRNNLHYNSWKQYKAAVVSYFEDFNHIEENEKEEILDLLKNAIHEVGNKKTNNTSNKKMKKFPMKEFTEILNFLMEKRTTSKFRMPLIYWLNAGILTGVRPTEWATSKYINEKGKERLIIKNAKNSNGRTHGDYRTIFLDKLSEEERKYIEEHVKTANYYHEIDNYSTYQKSCSDLLSVIGKKLWKNKKEYPSLYSLRHQFSADAKASGLSREEIAALMGHATDDTATIHYAKKSMGRKGAGFTSFCRVKANPEEVVKIKQVFNQNLKNNLKAKNIFNINNIVK